MNTEIKSVDDYIAAFPSEVRERMEIMREAIKKNAPEAVECIAYAMPAYKLNHKPLVYFAAYEKHIGFYATPTGHEKFKEQLSKYKQGKGSVQFPHSEVLPVDLIIDIVKFRVEENSKKK